MKPAYQETSPTHHVHIHALQCQEYEEFAVVYRLLNFKIHLFKRSSLKLSSED
jgi:hypothetical protein